ncbi:uncharacterized protein LOC101453054 [Ceratitis capitata]|uniref:uncharacterized protein LOC101453054 n=1 Tax=Ceratitis capitata TaxID=7213 RepID=UPI0003298090|nr:uncharacterized protein LOC101453054 [Ceratitis capitata]
MVPVEKTIPKKSFYYKFLCKWFIILFFVSLALVCGILALLIQRDSQQRYRLIDHCLNINFSVLQGFVGMPFWFRTRSSRLHKFISIIISFAGINFGAAYVAYLQSYIVNSPTEAPALTIDDLIANNVQIAMSKEILSYMESGEMSKLYNKFTLFKNLTELILLRNNLDPRYAYTVTNMWTIHAEQQKYFARPLFRLSEICFKKDVSLVMPLKANSIFRQSLSHFINRIVEAGLIFHWLRESFFELVAMKWISLEDPSTRQTFTPLKLEDLEVIITMFTVLNVLSFCCFLLEFFWAKIEMFFKTMKVIIRRLKRK